MTMTSLVLIFFVGQLQGLAFKSDEDPSLFEFGERSFQKMDEIVDDEELKKQSGKNEFFYQMQQRE